MGDTGLKNLDRMSGSTSFFVPNARKPAPSVDFTSSVPNYMGGGGVEKKWKVKVVSDDFDWHMVEDEDTTKQSLESNLSPIEQLQKWKEEKASQKQKVVEEEIPAAGPGRLLQPLVQNLALAVQNLFYSPMTQALLGQAESNLESASTVRALAEEKSLYLLLQSIFGPKIEKFQSGIASAFLEGRYRAMKVCIEKMELGENLTLEFLQVVEDFWDGKPAITCNQSFMELVLLKVEDQSKRIILQDRWLWFWDSGSADTREAKAERIFGIVASAVKQAQSGICHELGNTGRHFTPEVLDALQALSPNIDEEDRESDNPARNPHRLLDEIQEEIQKQVLDKLTPQTFEPILGEEPSGDFLVMMGTGFGRLLNTFRDASEPLLASGAQMDSSLLIRRLTSLTRESFETMNMANGKLSRSDFSTWVAQVKNQLESYIQKIDDKRVKRELYLFWNQLRDFHDPEGLEYLCTWLKHNPTNPQTEQIDVLSGKRIELAEKHRQALLEAMVKYGDSQSLSHNASAKPGEERASVLKRERAYWAGKVQAILERLFPEGILKGAFMGCLPEVLKDTKGLQENLQLYFELLPEVVDILEGLLCRYLGRIIAEKVEKETQPQKLMDQIAQQIEGQLLRARVEEHWNCRKEVGMKPAQDLFALKKEIEALRVVRQNAYADYKKWTSQLSGQASIDKRLEELRQAALETFQEKAIAFDKKVQAYEELFLSDPLEVVKENQVSESERATLKRLEEAALQMLEKSEVDMAYRKFLGFKETHRDLPDPYGLARGAMECFVPLKVPDKKDLFVGASWHFLRLLAQQSVLKNLIYHFIDQSFTVLPSRKMNAGQVREVLNRAVDWNPSLVESKSPSADIGGDPFDPQCMEAIGQTGALLLQMGAGDTPGGFGWKESITTAAVGALAKSTVAGQVESFVRKAIGGQGTIESHQWTLFGLEKFLEWVKNPAGLERAMEGLLNTREKREVG